MCVWKDENKLKKAGVGPLKNMKLLVYGSNPLNFLIPKASVGKASLLQGLGT